MQETKQPKDPKKVLWGTYLVIFAVVMLLNLWLFPKMVENRIEQVDYGTFLTMLEEGRLSTVEIEDQQIYFVDKDNVPYKTNSIPQDLDIVNRLKDAGVTFGKVYQQTQGQAGPNGGEQAGQGQQGGYQDGSVDADYTVEDDK